MPVSDGWKNLRPFNELTAEEHRQICSKGGKKSVEVRKEKKLFKDACKIVLDDVQEIALSNLTEELNSSNLAPETKIKILQFLADYSGQKPSEKQEILSSNLQININRQAVNEKKD